MENFGNIKDTFKKIILESVIKKDEDGKKLFASFIKNLKENKTLKNQFLIYKNLESRKFEDRLEAKEYIQENIKLLNELNKEDVEKSNSKLVNLLKGKKIVKENNSFYKDITYLSSVTKTPSNIDKINESMNNLINHMLTKDDEVSKKDNVVISPTILTNLMVNKFNEKYSEITESEKKIIKSISNILKIENSAFVTIDYGEYSKTCNDTLQAIYKNKKSNVLDNVGDSDITYQVNFFHLIELFKKNKLHIVDFATQSEFLQKLGIRERFAQAAKNLNKHRQDSLRNSVARLLHPLHMGGLFKVLVVTYENNKDLNYDI